VKVAPLELLEQAIKRWRAHRTAPMIVAEVQ
jgi:hypothetical protein